MNKKNYFETLRRILETRLNYYDPCITVRCDVERQEMIIVFPPDTKLISFVILDDIRQVSGCTSVKYCENHFEIVIHVFYIQ